MTQTPENDIPTSLPEDFLRSAAADVARGHIAIGTNVPMAYFYAGIAFARGVSPENEANGPIQDPRAKFYDAFTEIYWPSVNDDRRSGPYA